MKVAEIRTTMTSTRNCAARRVRGGGFPVTWSVPQLVHGLAIDAGRWYSVTGEERQWTVIDHTARRTETYCISASSHITDLHRVFLQLLASLDVRQKLFCESYFSNKNYKHNNSSNHK